MKFAFTIKKILSLLFSISLSLITVVAIINPETFIKYGYVGILIFAILGGQGAYILPTTISSFNPVLFILLLAFGKSIQDSIGYLIGKTSRNLVILNHFDNKLKVLVDKYGLWGIILLSAIPVPISNGLIGGLLKVRYLTFLIGTVIGKATLLNILYAMIFLV